MVARQCKLCTSKSSGWSFHLNLIDGVMDHAGASVRRLRIAIQQVLRGLKRDSMSIPLDQDVCSSELGPDATALLRSVPSGHVVFGQYQAHSSAEYLR